ncbi:seipin-2-like [Forsythia ovata]|uniref:Seipin-2-like n=1 Tax=Forsythia ovata TaxID=205694 RepID=A0ABD1S799_9LAMI
MDDSILDRNIDDIEEKNKGLFNNSSNFLGFRCKNEMISQNFIVNLMKYSLLLGAEKLLMARKLSGPLDCSTFDPGHDSEVNISENGRNEGKCVPGKYKNSVLQSSSSRYDRTIESSNKFVDMSKVMNFPAESIAFLAVLMLKMAGFQLNLFLRFFTFPIVIFNFWLMILMFPFQTLTWIRENLKKRLLRICNACYLILISFVFNQFNPQKSVLKMALRFGWAISCTFYVLFMLFGLLISGFVIGSLIVRNLVEEPMHTTEILNFDYTKTSPVAFVSITSSLVPNVPSGLASKHRIPASDYVGKRPIPNNHKLHLSVSLTLPESEYNRKLGIFQVRVESMSARNEVLASSSYPTMLRFKSQPIRLIETMFKTVPLITGLQSEVQTLKIEIRDYIEGYEPTAFFKVILEQRAEFQAGSGVPEIYAASLDIESELPGLKRAIWNWRRTILVWISISSFMGELMVVLLVCRPMILPGGRSSGSGSQKKSQQNKLPWNKRNKM